jgi:hypothetical protein
MPQAIHIFRKDLHRLRWAVVGWCAIVASRTVLATAGPDISLRTAEMELAVDHLNDMLGLVAWIDLSEDWFGGAELAVLEFVGAGSVTRTVTVDHFKMTP